MKHLNALGVGIFFMSAFGLIGLAIVKLTVAVFSGSIPAIVFAVLLFAYCMGVYILNDDPDYWR